MESAPLIGSGNRIHFKGIPSNPGLGEHPGSWIDLRES